MVKVDYQILGVGKIYVDYRGLQATFLEISKISLAEFGRLYTTSFSNHHINS